MRRVTMTMLIAAGFVLLATAALPTIRANAQPAPAVTDNNLDQMIADAKTASDHDAIAAYYEQEAAATEKKADLHRRTASTYRTLKIAKPVYMAEMCDGIATMWDKIATDEETLAKAHHEMAEKAAGTGQ